jgi:AP-2 complex subunit alpha
VRELEEKRINKEMANIRKKFKGACANSASHRCPLTFTPDGNLDGYQKKKCVSLLAELLQAS